MNKNYTPLSLKLKTIRTTSLQSELNKHIARLSGDQGTANQSVWDTSTLSCSGLQQLWLYSCRGGSPNGTDQPALTVFGNQDPCGQQCLYYRAQDPGSPSLWSPVTVLSWFLMLFSTLKQWGLCSTPVAWCYGTENPCCVLLVWHEGIWECVRTQSPRR